MLIRYGPVICRVTWLIDISAITKPRDIAFSALTPLVGHQEEHLACKIE